MPRTATASGHDATRSDAAGSPSIRRHNLSLVLGLLATEGPRSRASIAAATGITKATVSKLVADLEGRGLVVETTQTVGQPGRPATPIAVSGHRVVAIGVDIGVDAISVGAIDLLGVTHHLTTVVTDNRRSQPGRVIRRAASLVERLLVTIEDEGRSVAGMTIAVPGLTAAGRVLVAPNLGWRDVPLAATFARHLGDRATGHLGAIAIAIDNEANLAALAETAVRPERTFILISAEVGVGAGVVIDGGIFRGAHGFGGEFGHFVVDGGGDEGRTRKGDARRICACGNRGCLETVIGKDALMAACWPRGGSGGGRAVGPGGGRAGGPSRGERDAWVPRLMEGADRGEPRILAALEQTGEALAAGLAAAVSLFDPEAIVLGGYLTALTPWVAPVIEQQLQRRVLGSQWVTYRVAASGVGPMAALVGAGRASLDAVLADPLTIAPVSH